MKQKTIWVVVAYDAIASILQRPQPEAELAPVEELTDPAAHARGVDVRSDAYGRRGTSVTSSAGESEERHEAEAFALRVAHRLDEALQQKRFDELRIAAAPRFLGLLRRALSPQVVAVVHEQHHKDLVHASNRAITNQFFPPRARA